MGMTAFIIIWSGQVVSLLGTAMTNFALTIWAYQETGQATALALVGFFFMVPLLVFSPIAGALVDRSNRKLMMMISDLGAGLVTIIQLALFVTGNLEIWHLYVTAAIAGTFQTLQWPAFSAALTMMVPKEQYGRANGMMQLAGSASNIFAPILAALCHRLPAFCLHPPARSDRRRPRIEREHMEGIGLRLSVHPRPPQPVGPATRLYRGQLFRHAGAHPRRAHDPGPYGEQ
jgi:MFS family permease